MIEKMLYTRKNLCKNEWLVRKISLFQIQLGDHGGVVILGIFYIFYPHLKLETIFTALKPTKNCYINMNIAFY